MEDNDEKLAHILQRWQSASDSGRPITAEEACEGFPELVEEFSTLLKQLGFLEPILRGEPILETMSFHPSAGRFVPTTYHAKGGLGLVYRAEDTELKRVVALKFMQTLPGLDPEARQRFLSEAEITGKLEHPGIVPVYGLGIDSQDRPFYAMRFIQGANLGDAIEKLYQRKSKADPTEWNLEFRRLLQCYISVCQTLAYAHARGVIHRDIKPGNIMLGPYAETLVVDWGLARNYTKADPDETIDPGYDAIHVDHARADISLTGQVVGSPAYMSPEQAHGEKSKLTPATDIYSLGSTLYVLLTGKKPYNAPSTAATIELVKSGKFPLPRTLNPNLSKALEGVCLKAMAFEPSDRYATAKDLADDLNRWLADEPVSAYREPFLERTRRWTKRHRTLVTTTFSVLLIAVTLLVIFSIVLRSKNNDLAKEIELKENANRLLGIEISEKEVANQKLLESFQVTRKNFELGERKIRDLSLQANNRNAVIIPDVVRVGMNTMVYDYYGQFIDLNQNRSELSYELAYAELKQGESAYYLHLIDPLGNWKRERATEHLQKAENQLEIILKTSPTDMKARYGKAATLLKKADIESMGVGNEATLKLLKVACPILFELCENPSSELAVYTNAESPLCLLCQGIILARVSSTASKFSRSFPNIQSGHLTPALPLPYADWIERVDKILDKALQNNQVAGADLHLYKGLLLVNLAEDLIAQKELIKARGYFLKAREHLVVGLKFLPGWYEGEAAIGLIDYHLGLDELEANLGLDQAQMVAVANKFRELINRDWQTDPTRSKEQMSLYAARSSLAIALWTPKNLLSLSKIQKELENALNDLKRIDLKRIENDFQKKYQLLETLIHLLNTAKKMEVPKDQLTLIREQLQKSYRSLRTEFADSIPFQIKDIETSLDLGRDYTLANSPKAIELLKETIEIAERYAKQSPKEDQLTLLHGSTLHLNGLASVLVSKDYPKAFQMFEKAQTTLNLIPASSSHGNEAQQKRLEVWGMLAGCAEEIIKKEDSSPFPDSQKIQRYLAHAFEKVNRIEQVRPLQPAEKKLRESLEALSKKYHQPKKD